MATLHFSLVAPDKLAFEGEVEQVDVPGAEGDFGVLPGHAPVVSLLRPGIMTVHTTGGAKQRLVVLGGFAEVSPDGLTVLADVADSVEKFDAALVASQIGEMEQRVAAMEPGNLLDKAIARLDHFREVHRHLVGSGMQN